MTTWKLDPTESRAKFVVRHMLVTNVHGEFRRLAGKVSWDPAQPEATAVEASIVAGSIDTRESLRDAALRSRDFLDVEQFPTLDFASTAVRSAGRERLEIDGNLTIHGTTRTVTLQVEGPFPRGGGERLRARARTSIRRSDFGVVWGAAVEAGGVVVGDVVKIELDVSLVT
jgi:polyisoprenoid-binding protein YceI